MSKIESKYPQENVSVRVSIVDPSKNKLLLKKDANQHCVSSHESTIFISPFSTHPKSFNAFSSMNSWNESFVINQDIAYLQDKGAILFFEIIDQTIHPKVYHFIPLAWCFLRLKSGDNSFFSGNILSLQLFKYGKFENTNLVDGVPPCLQYFGNKEKFNGKLTISLADISPPDETIQVPRRPMTPFENEVGEKDFSELISLPSKKPNIISNIQKQVYTSTTTTADGTTITRQTTITSRIHHQRKEPIPQYLIRQIPVGEKGAQCVRFSHNGSVLAVAVENGMEYEIQLYLVSTWALLSSFSAHLQTIYEICFSNDDKYLLTVSGDSMAKVWDLSNLTVLSTLTHPSFVYSGKFHPQDNQYIATAGIDGVIYVWNWAQEKIFKQLRGHQTRINSIAFSQDGKKLFSGDADGVIFVWNSDIKTDFFNKFEKVTENEILHMPITHISTGKSPFSVLVQTQDNIVRNFETKVMVPSQRYVGAQCSKFRMESSFSPDGSMVYAASENGGVYLWAVKGSEPIQIKQWKDRFEGNPVSSVSWSPNGQFIAFSSFSPGQSLLIYSISPRIRKSKKIVQQEDEDY